MWKVFELNFIIFSIHRNGSEEMFFESKERVIGFLFKDLVGVVAHEMFGVK
jgi:hypothetical protein